MRTKVYFLAIIGLSVLHLNLTGQSRNEHMIWLEATEKIHFNPKLSALLLFQNRIFLEKEQTFQNLFWASAGYQLKGVTVGGGLMYFTYHKQLASVYKPVPEVRPFQYMSISRRLSPKGWTMQLRTMLEQRILSEVTGDEIDAHEDFQMRVRVRWATSIPLVANTSLRLRNEFIWADEMKFVQNRATAEVVYWFRSLGFAAGYMNWYLQGISQPVRHSWQLKVAHRLKLD